MKQSETRGRLLATSLRACPPLNQPSPEREALWFAVQQAICTRGLCLVTPLGSRSAIPVTPEHSTDELLSAMEWLMDHEHEARRLSAERLFIKLRGVATRGAGGSARAAQNDALHGLTHVAPGDPVAFTDVDPMDVAS